MIAMTESGSPTQPSPSAPDNQGAPWLRPDLVAPWWEIGVAGAIFIGNFTYTSIQAAMMGSSQRFLSLLFSNRHMLVACARESLFLAVFFAFLHYRGWKIADLRIKATWWSSLQGILLYLPTSIGRSCSVLGIIVLLYYLQTKYRYFLPFLLSFAPHEQPDVSNLSWPVLFVAVILNAFYEELICTGYLFNQFAAKRGPLFALLLLDLVRMSYHTYQGPVNVLGVGVIFLIYGAWYWWTRNLWSLIVAHAFVDLVSFGALKIMVEQLHPHHA